MNHVVQDLAPPARLPCLLEHLEGLSTWLQPLSNPVRLQLLAFLRQPHYLEEIASHLRMSHQAARKHVNQLKQAGLVRPSARSDTSIVEYTIDTTGLLRFNREMEGLCSLLHDDPGALGRTPSPPRLERPCLTIVRGHPTGAHIPLRNGHPVTIGRDPASAVAITHDPQVDLRHAELRSDPDGWSVMDLASDHGTWHNWRPLPRGGQRPLQHGDVVGIGRTMLLFWSE